MVPRDEVFAKMSFNNHKYLAGAKREKSPKSKKRSKLHESVNHPVSKLSSDIMTPELRDNSFLSNSQKMPHTLFNKLRKMQNTTLRKSGAFEKRDN